MALIYHSHAFFKLHLSLRKLPHTSTALQDTSSLIIIHTITSEIAANNYCSKCMNEIHVKFVVFFFFPAYTFGATWWCPYYMTSIAKSGIVTERHTNRLSCLCFCGSHVHLMSSDSTYPQQRQQAAPLGSPSLRSLTHSLCALMEGRAATVCVILSVTLASACSADRATVLKVHI